MSNLYDQQPLKETGSILLKNVLTIAVAESVTAGHIQAALSSAKDASIFFQGGLTAYNLFQKSSLLQVDAIQAAKCDCVSEEVAIEMAMGVSKLFGSNVGVGITGYASLAPEKDVNELYAYAAIVQNGIVTGAIKLFGNSKDPVRVQVHYANRTLHYLSKVLMTKGSKRI